MSNVPLNGNTIHTKSYLWWSPDGFTMVPVTSANPLPVTGGGGGGGGTSSNFGATFPTSGTATGAIDSTGKMAGLNLDASGNLKVAGSFSASFSEATATDTGSVSSAAVIFTQADTTGYYSVWFQIGGIGTSTVVAEINNTGTWVPVEVAPVATLVGQSSITSNGMYVAATGGLGFRLRVSVYDGSATITATGFFRGFPFSLIPSSLAVTAISLPLPTGASTSALQTTGNTALTTINTTLGSPFQAGGSIGNTTFASTQSGTWTVAISAGSAVIGHVITDTGSTTAVTQATAASLNATVVGTGTFAVQAAQSGTWNIGTVTAVTAITNALPAGTNVIGHVITDSTSTTAVTQATASNLNAAVIGTGTAGSPAGGVLTIQGVTSMTKLLVTPDSVALPANQSINQNQIVGTTVDVNSGTKSAGTQRIVIATDQPQLTNALKVDGSAVTQPVSGTVTANPTASTPILKNGLTNTASAVVSSTAATLKSYYVYNPNSSVAYVQIFDVATAGGVTVGTTTPKWSIGIPATSGANIGTLNLTFASGIQIAATTTATGSTAPSTALDANFGYS